MLDYLIVGSGLYGATFANIASSFGKKCLVIDQRSQIGGNCYTENRQNIDIHKYGAHIFHTNNEKVWKYVNQFAKFIQYINSPIVNINNKIYNLPFNMNLFHQVFNEIDPKKIQKIIDKEKFIGIPTNLEEQAMKLVGKTIYEMFIKEYTEKQWGKACKELPPETIKRLPLRFTYDNNYFDDEYQGIPVNGYTNMIKKMLENIEVRLNTKYDKSMLAKKIIYTGMIDEFFNYKYGELEYRTLEFVELEYRTDNHQGNAVINYPNSNIPYTRSIEHKHFNKENKSDRTIVSYEFSKDYTIGDIPFYPINDKKNNRIYEKYKKLGRKCRNIYFVGRLGEYKYYDMDDTIENAMNLISKIDE